MANTAIGGSVCIPMQLRHSKFLCFLSSHFKKHCGKCDTISTLRSPPPPTTSSTSWSSSDASQPAFAVDESDLRHSRAKPLLCIWSLDECYALKSFQNFFRSEWPPFRGPDTISSNSTWLFILPIQPARLIPNSDYPLRHLPNPPPDDIIMVLCWTQSDQKDQSASLYYTSYFLHFSETSKWWIRVIVRPRSSETFNAVPTWRTSTTAPVGFAFKINCNLCLEFTKAQRISEWFAFTCRFRDAEIIQTINTSTHLGQFPDSRWLGTTRSLPDGHGTSLRAPGAGARALGNTVLMAAQILVRNGRPDLRSATPVSLSWPLS